jgi:hypothetical protein
MSEQANDREDWDLGEAHAEFGGNRGVPPLRLRQLRLQAQAQMADAQRAMARAIVKSARYMLWATTVCAVSSVITVGAVLYSVLVVLPHVGH